MKSLVPKIAAGALAAACASLLAASPPRPPVLKALEARGVSDLQEFKIDGDLRGFAGVAGRSPVVVYVTKGGSAVVGVRVDEHGAPMDGAAVEALITRPMEEGTWRAVEAAKWVREGRADAPHVVYVFTDANCPWCHRFFEAARPAVAAGKVQLRQIFVGVIKADSAAKAAAILVDPDPAAAAERNERDFDKGGVAPLPAIPEAAGKTLAANLRLMDSLGFRGTPGLVWRDADGRVKTLGGFPQGERMAQVLGGK